MFTYTHTYVSAIDFSKDSRQSAIRLTTSYLNSLSVSVQPSIVEGTTKSPKHQVL